MDEETGHAAALQPGISHGHGVSMREGNQGIGARYTVIVRGLVLMCSIGIRREERQKLQRVRISVELTASDVAAWPSEDRRSVINYEKVVAAIRAIAASGHIDLCEGFAERICVACFEDPRVAHLRVTVEKLDVFPEGDSVGAIVERSRPA
jgi:dihydroneopterin aldolase